MRLICTIIAAVALPSAALAGPLTFDDALTKARADAPSIKAKVLAADATRSARIAAGQLPDPKLGLGIDSFPISGPLAFQPSRDNFTWARIGVSQDIPNLAKRRAQRGRADADIAVADAAAAVELRVVEVQTAIAWINLAYAERRLAALDEVLARLGRIVRTSPSAVASGNARPAQTLAGRAALARLQDRRDELVSAVARAKAELTRWTGEADPEVAGSLPDIAVDPVRLRASLERQPALVLLGAQADRADADLRLAQADRRPDFGVDLSYQRRDPRFGDYVSAGVTIGLPLFKKNRQNPVIAARAADAGAARADSDAALRALTADLDAGLADHVMHHDQWMRARDVLQPLAQERVTLDVASYAAGRASLIDLVDAHAALADAILETLDREATVAADGVRLNLLFGNAGR
ncbi:TolC family protein [Hankyongella ginsenosidimutans]|uniref:TolC family protein n=1 Tax=Hankyongella ginsenosidimutans TaxID=1763828 RepID=A0A4D7C6Z8_9SPHN|nr:TolC family protein [Hankyongella ginsenosidimutans]QCI78828.1 TolC family protein [Hankyongella ginsenosidimutans]